MADRRHVTNSGLLEDLVPHRTEAEARAAQTARKRKYRDFSEMPPDVLSGFSAALDEAVSKARKK